MTDYIDVTGTPYYLEFQASSGAARQRLGDLADRVELLRRNRTLSPATLQAYYGEKRFEQIAESNALEGSTLTAGETELAVIRGVTFTGHDPAFVRDAQALARALDRLVELARGKEPTSLDDLRELHALIVGDRPGSGTFRTAEVRIRGSKHVPPRTWREVMDGMESWAAWSSANALAPPMLRAAVLHAWLTHIHPFSDGNGRTARAISTLELVRAGYPPVIIRHKDRDRYLDSLGEGDQGQLGSFLDLMIRRADDALRELERAATKVQGYDPVLERRRRNFAGRLAVWNAGVHLLVESLRARLRERLEPIAAHVEVREFDELTTDAFIELCEGRAIGQSWAFTLSASLPTGRKVRWLCWAGYLRPDFKDALSLRRVDHERPALMWSVPTGAYPPWRQANASETPGGEQMTIATDKWVLWTGSRVEDATVSTLADRLADRVIDGLVPSAEL